MLIWFTHHKASFKSLHFSQVNNLGDKKFNARRYADRSCVTQDHYFPKPDSKFPIYPNQQHINLYRYLVAVFANEEDLVLHINCNVGISAIAATSLKLRYYGFTHDVEYIEALEEHGPTMLIRMLETEVIEEVKNFLINDDTESDKNEGSWKCH